MFVVLPHYRVCILHSFIFLHGERKPSYRNKSSQVNQSRVLGLVKDKGVVRR